MIGSMMDNPLLVSDLIVHAQKFYADTQFGNILIEQGK